MSYKFIPVINPSPAKAKAGKPKRKKTMAAKKRGRRKARTQNKGHVKHHNTAPKKRNAHHKPATAYYTINGGPKKNTSVKKGHVKHHHKKHNPDVPAAYDPLKVDNLVYMGLGAGTGALITPIIGNVLSKQFNITGELKYGAQLAASLAIYYFGKKFMPKAALSYVLVAAGVTLYQYFQEKQIISGTEQLLGLSNNTPNFSALDMANFRRMASNINQAKLNGGIIVNRPHLGIIGPNNARKNTMQGIVGPSMRSFAADGSRMTV